MIKNDIYYIGVNDHEIDLFEGQYVVPNGMAYNSYVILDDKIAVMDTVDARFADEWLKNLETALSGKSPDFLIVQHMEPDHSGSITHFTEKYPDAKIVASAKAFAMMKQFFGVDFSEKAITVTDCCTLELGNHTLNFVTAPMVHWPEVIMTYDSTAKVLFSADAFGKFGALDADEDWACEARRYYFGIVGKYGAQAQAVLKKASGLDIETICPLHGPVLSEDLGYYLNLYNIWTTYGVESEGVAIAYASIYGNTKKAAEMLRDELLKLGCPKVAMMDLARDDWAECVEDAFRYGKLVLASITYNNGVLHFMSTFINNLIERGYKNRTVGFIENGSWAPNAAKVMRCMLECSKDIAFTENNVKILSAINDENIEQIKALAKELM